MDFTLNAERQMLRDSLDRCLARAGGLHLRRDTGYVAPFHDLHVWNDLVGLGALHALLPEAQGGLGGTGADIMVVFEALGRAAVPGPLLGTLLAARLLAAAGADLSDLLEGRVRYAAALSEPATPHDPLAVATRAARDRLTGAKAGIAGGNDADVLLVLARQEGRHMLYAVARHDVAEFSGYAMIDGGGAADLVLNETPGRLLLADADTAVAGALDAGLLALCAEAVGLMESGLGLMLTQLRERHQFGQPLGSFQVLRHRAVDMLGMLEQARSITLLAARDLDTPQSARSAAMAKMLIGRLGKKFSDALIQTHGGMGLVWDHPVSHLGKRLVMIDHHLGSSAFHLSRLAAPTG